MKRAIVVGASSGMGWEISKLLIADGWKVGIAARRTDRLLALKKLHSDKVVCETIDITQEESSDLLLNLIKQLGGIDLYFHASGTGKKNPDLHPDIELDTVNVNAIGFIRMIDTAYRYMADNGGGHIAVITSIAGTKGLGLAPSYSATKSFQNSYIEALQQQANKRGLNISFTDIRPGFVDTDLLNDDYLYPMLMNVQYASKKIIKAIYRKKQVCIIDWRWRIVTIFWRFIPRFIWVRIKL